MFLKAFLSGVYFKGDKMTNKELIKKFVEFLDNQPDISIIRHIGQWIEDSESVTDEAMGEMIDEFLINLEGE